MNYCSSPGPCGILLAQSLVWSLSIYIYIYINDKYMLDGGSCRSALVLVDCV